MVDEALGILSGHENLAHMGYVEHTDVLPHRFVLVDDAAVLYRHIETRKGAHLRTQLHVPVVQTSLLQLFFHISVIVLVNLIA